MNDGPLGRPKGGLSRLVLAAGYLAAIVVLAIQYTPHAFLDDEGRTTMWGVLAGLVFGTFLFRKIFWPDKHDG